MRNASQETTDAPSFIVRSPTHDRRACPSFVLPTRMGYRWRNFNHRISVWKFGLNRSDGGHPWADSLQAHSVGGPFSDGLGQGECPQVKFGFQRIDVDSIEDLGAARSTIRTTIGPGGTIQGTKRFGREALSLTGYRSIVAVITGFGFDTGVDQTRLFPRQYHPAHGYVTRGLGADIRVTDLTDESVEIGFSLRYGFGASMDRPHHNEALLEAQVGAELDIALIGATDIPFQTGRVDYQLDYEEPQIGVQQQIDPAPRDLQSIRLDGESRAPAGIWGIQGFNFDLSPDRSCDWNRDWPMGEKLRGEGGGHPKYGLPGYYIRELTLDLSQRSYDPRTGEAEFLFNGYASNSTLSIPFHPLRSHFTGQMIWLQSEATTEDRSISSEFQTGAAEFPLA